MTEFLIRPCTMEHLEDYASVYARDGKLPKF